MPAHPPPDWAAIASFYAGRPVTIGVDTRGPLQATTGVPESGQILLGSDLRKGLDNWYREWAKAKTRKQRMGLAALGANPLAVLLHEAAHNRNFRGTGLRDAGSESQAAALGAEFIPDMLQRFFNVKMGSKLSKAYMKAAKSRAEYQAAYMNPPTLPFARRP